MSDRTLSERLAEHGLEVKSCGEGENTWYLVQGESAPIVTGYYDDIDTWLSGLEYGRKLEREATREDRLIAVSLVGAACLCRSVCDGYGWTCESATKVLRALGAAPAFSNRGAK